MDLYVEGLNGIQERALLAALYDIYEGKKKFLDKINNAFPEMKPLYMKKKTGDNVVGNVVTNEEEKQNGEAMFPADSLYAFEVGYEDYLIQRVQQNDTNSCSCGSSICTCGNGRNYVGATISTEMKPDEFLSNKEEKLEYQGMFPEDGLYAFEVGYDDYLRKQMVPETEEKNVITLENVEQLVDAMNFSEIVKKHVKAIYKLLARSKGMVESNVLGRVDLSEYSKLDDAIIVAGICHIIEDMSINSIKVSPINLGQGHINTNYGFVPIPVPVTANLVKGVPNITTEEYGELTSPLGAAVVKYFADEFVSTRAMVYDEIGYGFFSDEDGENKYVRVFAGEIQ